MAEAIIIPADSNEPIIRCSMVDDSDLLDNLREAIGCDIVEHIAALGDCDAYGDEEAKLKNTPIPGYDPDEHIVLVNGEPMDAGDIPESDLWEQGTENVRATAIIYGDKDEARKRDEQQQQEYRDMGFEVIDGGTGDPREPFIAGDIVLVKREVPDTTNRPPMARGE